MLGSEQKGARDGEQGGRLTRSGRCQGRRPSSDVVLASAFAASPAFRAALRAGLRQCGVADMRAAAAAAHCTARIADVDAPRVPVSQPH